MRLDYQSGRAVSVQRPRKLADVGIRQLAIVGVCREHGCTAIDEKKPIQSECLEYVHNVLVDVNETDNGRGAALPQPQSNDR